MTPKRVDANQAAIVADLRKLGATVLHLHTLGNDAPDLLVGFRGVNYLLEVKGPKGRPSQGQVTWHDSWLGQVAVIKCTEEAMAVMGIEIA